MKNEYQIKRITGVTSVVCGVCLMLIFFSFSTSVVALLILNTFLFAALPVGLAAAKPAPVAARVKARCSALKLARRSADSPLRE